jgi:inward rectifier potassium channel
MKPVQKPGFDPGLTQQYTGSFRRVVGKDGSFNVTRSGGDRHDFHIYLHLINMRWPQFFAVVLGGYFLVNTVFAVVYFWLGPGELLGGDASTE